MRTKRKEGESLKEFLEEYGSIIVIASIGYAVMSGLWKILIVVSSV